MNYLAHAYLSFKDPEILIGNMIADFIRGNQMYEFSPGIQAGIKIHRFIDEFTDHHPLTKEIKKVFEISTGRYSASFLDISFDHFLALDRKNEPVEGWKEFSSSCYRIIDDKLETLPGNFKELFYYMKTDNFLYNYKYKWMIRRSFNSLVYRAKYLPGNVNPYSDFKKNYKFIQKGYEGFFPDLLHYVKDISNKQA